MKNSIIDRLKSISGDLHCKTDMEDRLCYSYDSGYLSRVPDAVLFPENTDEISHILKLANKEKFSVIPRGAGTGMTGGSVPLSDGGIVLSLLRLKNIKKIDTDNFISVVEPGVVTGVFHRKVEKLKLFYPPDPSSSDFCTLGGNAAECAGGPHAVKYGVTKDYVLGLEVVLPTGEIIHTGVQTAKGVVGYDLTKLIVGSEGTLGVITELTLRLLALPLSVSTMTAMFDSVDAAACAVSEIIRQGVIPRTIEYMDRASIKCVERFLDSDIVEKAEALLIIEVDGTVRQTKEDMLNLKELCFDQKAVFVETAKNKAEVEKLWKARKSISSSLFCYGPDKINEDIVVPRNRIPDMVKKIEELKDKSGLYLVSFGHAGDGNIHFNIMLDKTDKTAFKKAELIIDELFDYTVRLGGSISGEHGIGITKLPFIIKEINSVELDLMKKIKTLFDPNNILNPGKIFP